MDDPELEQLAEDWITLWESELAALAADPELAEHSAAGLGLWAGLWRAQLGALMPRARHEPGDGPPRGADAPPRPAPGAAPSAAGSGAGDAGEPAWSLRLADLERRLAALEGGAGGDGADRPPPRRPRQRRPTGG